MAGRKSRPPEAETCALCSQAGQVEPLLVPYMHALALLLQRMSRRDYPAPHRWAWLLLTCSKQIEDVGGLRNLADRVRDLSVGGVDAALPPLYFGRPKIGVVTPQTGQPPRILMKLFIYCLAVVCHSNRGIIYMHEHVPASGVWHSLYTESGDLYLEISSAWRIDAAKLLDSPEATWAFMLMTSEAAVPVRSDIVASLRSATPRHPAALIAVAEMTAAELTAQSLSAAAKKDLDAAEELTHARSSASEQALSFMWSEFAVVSTALQMDSITEHALMRVSTISQSTSGAARSAALMFRDLNEAQDLQRVLQQKHAQLVAAASVAAVAARTAVLEVASAQVGDRFAAGIRSQMSLLRGLVKPSMVDFVAGLQVVEFAVLSFLCSLPTCRHTSLPMQDEGLYWPASRPWKLWRGMDAWQAAQRRKLLVGIDDGGDEAVDPMRYVSWLCESKTNEELFLNVSGEARVSSRSGTPVDVGACSSLFVVALKHVSALGRELLDVEMRPAYSLPLNMASEGWARTNGRGVARGAAEVLGLVEAHMRTMVRFRPGVITADEMGQLLNPVVQLMMQECALSRGAKRPRPAE